MQTVVLESGREDWCTSNSFLSLVRQVAPIALDPCGNARSLVNACVEFYGPHVNDVCGLTTPWAPFVPSNMLAYCNPPYGYGLTVWCEKFAREAEQGVQIIALIPARVGTKYWHDYVWPEATQILFPEGREKFIDPITLSTPRHGATFDAAVIYYGNRRARFDGVFGPHGQLYRGT